MTFAQKMGVNDNIPRGYEVGRAQKYTPEQMDLFKQMFQYAGPDSYLAKLAAGDEEAFQQAEAPAFRQFSGLQGNLASRFSGMGMGSGARGSSGFQNTMNQAASNFAQDLQGRRQQMQMQALQELRGLSRDLLTADPYNQFMIQKQPSQTASFMQGVLPVAGAVAGGIYGGPQGASAGYQIGSAAGSAFGGQPQGQVDWSGISSLPSTWG